MHTKYTFSTFSSFMAELLPIFLFFCKKVLTNHFKKNIINIVPRNTFRYARVAQWWSIALPRRGPRVRIPSRASFILNGNLYFQGFPLFCVYKSCRHPVDTSTEPAILSCKFLFLLTEKTSPQS